MNLVKLFLRTAARQPWQPAIVGPGDQEACTYGDLRAQIEITARRLKELGVQPGHCVGVHYPSGKDYIILTYALWRCKACAVPIPVELAAEEKCRIVRDINMRGVVAKQGTAGVIDLVRRGKTDLLNGELVWVPVECFRHHPMSFAQIDAAFVRFTSGTTGECKGVVLSHRTIAERISAANEVLHIDSADRVVWLLSMSYHFAVSIVSYLSFGATIVLCKNHLGKEILQTAARSNGTLIYGAPMHFALMAGDAGSTQLPRLRLAISTTTGLRREIAEAFQRRFQKPLSQAYGIIEIGLPCINVDGGHSRWQSVGRVLPSYEVRFDDVGLGPDMKAIRFRGKGMLDAYYEPWRTRKDIMPDGWFATGDLGGLNSEGYLYIRGRTKDVINVAGMKFFPQEVEAVLEGHPGVKEACVFAQPHKQLGEVGCARVVPTDSQADLSQGALKKYCARHLAIYKVPEEIQIVDTLMRTASGKVIRRELRSGELIGGHS